MNLKSLIWCSIIIVSLFSVCTAFESGAGSARSLALGGVKTTLVGPRLDGLMLGNPAALSRNKAGIMFHYNNRFGLSDYKTENVSFFGSTNKCGFAVTYLKNGVALKEDKNGSTCDNFWGNQRLGAGMGFHIKGIYLGMNLWRYQEVVEIDEDLSWMGGVEEGFIGDLGFLYESQDKRWGIGIVSKNLPLSKLTLDEQEYNFGFRYGQEGNLSVYTELVLNKNGIGIYQIKPKGGVEAWLSDKLALRLGVDSAQMITVGLGVYSGRWQLDYAFRNHTAGISHYMTTGYCF